MNFNVMFDSSQTNLNYETDQDSYEDNGSDWYNCEELESDDEELINVSSNKVFCFETDHAALIGNTDYHNLMRTLSLLQAQRIKVIEDIERLEKLRCAVQNNPKEYLSKMLSIDNSIIPSRIEVQEVPEIDWSKYRLLTSNNKTSDQDASTINHFITSEPELSTKYELKINDSVKEESSAMTVRGRKFDQSKPLTFNQLWTAEEQLRLEELLVQFPPESNENNRWRKIAQALGNRTTKQVCSRVQKYFKKLTEAGLPIPGHQLKTSTLPSLKKKCRRSKKRSKARNSTFFPTQHLGAPHHLDAGEDDEIKTKAPLITSAVKTEILEKVIEYKKRDSQLSPFSHPNVMCTVCDEMPLQGTRWHCLVCQNVNLCSDCVISQLDSRSPKHAVTHPLEPLTNPSVAHWDPDYMPDSFQSDNYLDPNFVSSNVL